MPINKLAAQIKEAVDGGLDPLNIELDEGAAKHKVPKARGSNELLPLLNPSAPITFSLSFSFGSAVAFVIFVLLLIFTSDRCYGSTCTKSSILNLFNRNIRPNIKLIKAALEAGDDPAATALYGLSGQDPSQTTLLPDICLFSSTYFTFSFCRFLKFCVPLPPTEHTILTNTQEIAKYFDDCTTKKALMNVFDRNIKPNVRNLRSAVDASQSPATVTMFALGGTGIAIAAHFGSDATAIAIQTRINRFVKPPARRLQECVKAGVDPKTIDVTGGVKGDDGCQDSFFSLPSKAHFPSLKPQGCQTAACMGSDVTKKALEWQFSVTLKNNAQLIKDARAAGRDCKDLNLTLGGSASSKK
ncbi:hypothetical protein HYALB_00005254 [Hymenoscyphus albidus]|uniref:Uncharacterized protein n=1 Tax=Hymenoscyphus albidus TaxID=595503 RepID=A0A9N9Q8Y4_9HELO|nr:hypothetical protein HYALB_00005254 [Hymenoscyphus albidus]